MGTEAGERDAVVGGLLLSGQVNHRNRMEHGSSKKQDPCVCVCVRERERWMDVVKNNTASEALSTGVSGSSGNKISNY